MATANGNGNGRVKWRDIGLVLIGVANTCVLAIGGFFGAQAIEQRAQIAALETRMTTFAEKQVENTKEVTRQGRELATHTKALENMEQSLRGLIESVGLPIRSYPPYYIPPDIAEEKR